MADTQTTGDQTVGASRGIETVEIVNPYNPNKIIRINAADFDEKKHVKLNNGRKPRTQEELELLRQYQATHESIQAAKPASEQDERDIEIRRLRAEIEALRVPKKPAADDVDGEQLRALDKHRTSKKEKKAEEEKAEEKTEKEPAAEVKHVGKATKHPKTEPTDSLAGLDEV